MKTYGSFLILWKTKRDFKSESFTKFLLSTLILFFHKFLCNSACEYCKETKQHWGAWGAVQPVCVFVKIQNKIFVNSLTLNRSNVIVPVRTPIWYLGCWDNSNKLFIGNICGRIAIRAVSRPENMALTVKEKTKKADTKNLPWVLEARWLLPAKKRFLQETNPEDSEILQKPFDQMSNLDLSWCRMHR